MDHTLSLPEEEQHVIDADSPADLEIGEPDEAVDSGAPSDEWTGPRCEKCAAPLKSDVVTICRNCGWYASLGTYVEVDAEWEKDDEDEQTPAAQPNLKHVQVWLNLLPRWAWILIASVMAVVVESVVARLVTPSGSSVRTIWSLTQLAVGTLVFASFHVFNFLTLAAQDADMGVLDLIVKPIRTWLRTFARLPNRLWIVNSAACGLMAAVMSLVVIGGIPYHVLWDWGFKQPPKQDLMGAVMSRVQQAGDEGEDDNLEDAVNSFAGSQDVEPPEPPKPQQPAPKLRERADCVILGYRLGGEGRISMLLLGTARRGKLVYAGYVRPELSDEEMAELVADLERVKTSQPFLSLGTTAIWVEPKYTCRVTFSKRTKSGRLTNIQWDELLGSLSVP